MALYFTCRFFTFVHFILYAFAKLLTKSIVVIAEMFAYTVYTYASTSISQLCTYIGKRHVLLNSNQSDSSNFS